MLFDFFKFIMMTKMFRVFIQYKYNLMHQMMPPEQITNGLVT